MKKNDHKLSVDPDLLNVAIWNNACCSLLPGAKSVGFRTNATQYRTASQNSALSVAEDFLANSRHVRNDRENECSILAYLEDPGVTLVSLAGHEDNSATQHVSLPESVPLDIKLSSAILNRHSVRAYTGEACDLEYLATIARAACGVSSNPEIPVWGGGSVNMHFRTVPSGGALYPIDLYVAALKVRNLKSGIYRYHPLSDQLIHVDDKTAIKNLLNAFSVPNEQIAYRQANMIFMLVAHPWRSMRKYGARGVRFVFHEAGAISQNIHLALSGLGLGSVDCASVYDDEAHVVLNIDGVHRALVHTIVAGVPK